MKAITRILALAVALLAASSPAGAACYQWSKTAGNNANADLTINWSEGMAPSAINDSARAMMARLAECRDDLSGLLTTSGTSTHYTVTTNQTLPTTPSDGQAITIRPHATNAASADLAADSGTAYPIQTSPGVAVGAGTLVSGVPYRLTFSLSGSAWLLQDFYNTTIAPGSITTALLADANVTYAKIQNASQSNVVLGRYTSGAGVLQELTVGTGLALSSGGTLSAVFPPAGSFRNLAIKVTDNTHATVTADYVTTTNGTSFQTTAVNCTINLGTTGINALDVGSIASATWYAVWVDVKSDGTTGCTTSLQGTANATFLSNLPSGYTYYARVGWLRTASGSAQLMGTWQFGRRAQYVVGLAQTASALPNIANGIAGTFNGNASAPTWAAQSVSNFVPTTASIISLMAQNSYNGAGTANVGVAPNNNYSAPSTTDGPILNITNTAAAVMARGDMLLESSSIYWYANANGGAISCVGWEDNL